VNKSWADGGDFWLINIPYLKNLLEENDYLSDWSQFLEQFGNWFLNFDYLLERFLNETFFSLDSETENSKTSDNFRDL